MNKPLKYTSISFSMHVFLMALCSGVLFQQCSKGPGDGRNSPIQGNKITKAPESVEASLMDKPSKGFSKQRQPKKPKLTKCPGTWYGGIGVTNNYENRKFIVVEAVKGYPAYKAGIETGDELIDGCPTCVGEPGEEIQVNIRKQNGQNRIYNIYRDRICSGD